jgi:hypothetical protein
VAPFQANDFGPLIITRVIGRFILIFISSKIKVSFLLIYKIAKTGG